MKTKVIKFSLYKGKRSDIIMCEILKKLQGKTAQSLLEDYNISKEPPIDIDVLLNNIGISSVPMDFSSIEDEVKIPNGSILGATIAKEEDLSIFYRVDATENRRRFTIAHEIAHCCLHTNNLIDHHIELRGNFKSLSGKEYDANVFAGALLIPEEALHKVYKQLIVPSLETLSKIFRVSTTVMVARLDYLNMPYFKDIEINEA